MSAKHFAPRGSSRSVREAAEKRDDAHETGSGYGFRSWRGGARSGGLVDADVSEAEGLGASDGDHSRRGDSWRDATVPMTYADFDAPDEGTPGSDATVPMAYADFDASDEGAPGSDATVPMTYADFDAPDEGAPGHGLIRPVAIGLLVVFGVQGALFVSILPALRIIALVLASLASVAGVWACACWTRNDEQRANALMYRVFCIALVALGFLHLAFFPPHTVPDENIHYSAAYSYANHLDPTMGQYEVRTEDLEFIRDPVQFGQEFTADYWEWCKGGLPVFATHEGTAEDSSFAHDVDFGADAPQLRLFSAIGVLLGRLFNLSGVLTFYLGRLLNLLSCVVLIACAVRLLPVGRNIMMTISLLPMTLHLLGSYSYDSTIIGLAFLLIALLLRAMLGEGRMSRRLEVACVVVAVLLAPCKIVYTVLALLAFAVPTVRFGSRREVWIWRGCMLALPLLAVLVMRMGKLLVMAGVSGGENKAARRSSTESLYTLGDVLAHPLAPAGMLVRTLEKHGDFYLGSMVGGSLAWFQQNIEAHQAQVFGLLGVLCVSGLSAKDDLFALGRRTRAACALVFALGVLAVFFSMILIWTVAGANIIQGVQGRYFIPFLPLLLLGLRGRTIVARDALAPVLLATLAGFNCIYLAQIAFVVLGGVV